MRGSVVKLAALAVLLLLAGCTSTATVSTHPSGAATAALKESPKIGTAQDITDGANRYTVTVSHLVKAKPGQFATVTGTLYAVTVSITVTAGQMDANPLSFSARDAAGDSYDAALGGTDVQLASVTLPAGQKLRGPVAFDVPKGQSIAVIVMQVGFGAGSASWQI